MKNIIKLEEAGFFLLAVFLFSRLDYAWWLFPVLLFLPDISVIGYLWNNRAGAIFYNLVHFRGIGILLYLIGLVISMPPLILTGIIFFAHSSLDRIMGYGLKTYEGFKFTHLGEL